MQLLKERIAASETNANIAEVWAQELGKMSELHLLVEGLKRTVGRGLVRVADLAGVEPLPARSSVAAAVSESESMAAMPQVECRMGFSRKVSAMPGSSSGSLSVQL